MIRRTLQQRLATPLARNLASSAVVRSHVGSAPIPYPPTLSLALAQLPAAPALNLTGPKGTYTLPLAPFVNLSLTSPPPPASSETPTKSASPPSQNIITVSVEDPTIKRQRATWGLTRALIANAVQGLTEGFEVPLRLVGVGYRAAIEPDPTATPPGSRERLRLKLGFAHDVVINVPGEIKAEVPAPTKIVLKGTDKHVLGLFAAKIRKWRKPEPYKGKGIFVGDETIRLKDVKKK
ncbi:hypothetical protein BOTBODRAFT_192827 [Botryobasidium botryosum FD-172 SS1]|uniref:Large ribosomal subunit protein uL6 alpha-beta domain-containing protein n=1 Tax=Botryobasidium botryosum (strain FD-172 SS1) TaxID=930990 RepID=A0A067LWV1_BOTB1|nr:hypothetical protein BOTBODRAFT_192827 [Botryobasidium botryosum FD-172 SS1]